MLLTGATASVVRACIMSILELISFLFYRKSDVYNNLAISSFIILTLNPYNIFDMGFLLSYGGTVGIILFSDKLSKKYSIKNKILNYIKEMFFVCISANIIIIPIIMYNFNTLSLTFFISNILVSPIMGLIVLLGFIQIFLSIISTNLAYLLSLFLNPLLEVFIFIAEFTSKLPLSKILIPTPNIILIIVYYVIVFFWYITRIYHLKSYEQSDDIYFNVNTEIEHKKCISYSKIKFRRIIVGLIILILVFNLLNILPKDLRIYFIDVGQGDSTLILSPKGNNILIDGGGSETGNFDVGEKILLPYLLDRNITKIDYMMISHFDSDHVGGLFAVLENLKVKNVLISKQGKDSENYKAFLEISKRKKFKTIYVKAGDRINIEKNMFLEILFPTNNLISENILNNNSIVARLVYKKFKVLFTGDVEEIAEKELTKLYSQTNKLNADILKVAHHGSKSSTVESFLKLVNPKISLIGVGENNKFGHPNLGVLKRIERIWK